MKKTSKWSYITWILVSEAVGALSGWLTRDGTEIFNNTVNKPSFTPPPIVFPIVWGILFALMGIGVARVFSKEASDEKTAAVSVYFAQLIMNFFWTLIFFNLQSYGFAFFWIIVLWLMILWMISLFKKLDAVSAYLQIPYLIWAAFAAVLNYFVWRMN